MDIDDVIKYQTIDLSCPRCGNHHPQTVAWLNSHDYIHCGCGEIFSFDKQLYLQKRHQLELHFQKYLNELEPFASD